MGFRLDRVLMDPSTGALGYGLEYRYSVMERLRLAAFMGDAMTAAADYLHGRLRVLAPEGRLRRGRRARGVGGLAERGVVWEISTASTLLGAGADILVMRHPEV